ncbi:MAG: MATE family efflux transporter [Candidatus Excrementavichristensenella sp.]|jgi:putative MATE family efflux protein
MLLRDKGFRQEFNSLYWWIVLQNVVILSVNLLDNIMLGAHGEVALSGASAVNQITFVLQQVVLSFGNALVVLGTQYWGQKRREPLQRLLGYAILGAVAAGLFLFFLCSLQPEPMVRLFTKDQAIIREGIKYLGIIRWTYPLLSVTTVVQLSMQCVGKVRLPFACALMVLGINFVLNTLLIPRYGVEGAAAATLVSRIAEFLVSCISRMRTDKRHGMNVRGPFLFDRGLLSDYAGVVWPLMIINVIWGLNTSLQTMALGHMEHTGAGILAANSIATTLFAVIKTASQGSASVANIMVGAAVGKGDIKRVKDLTKTLQLIFIIVGLASSMILFLLRAPILSIYKLNPETRQLANKFLLVLCFTGMGTSYQMPTIMGIVRGGGDARFGMVNDLVSIVGVVIPLSLTAAFVWRLSPVHVVLCQNADQVLKCVAAAIKVNRYKWIRDITREGI